MVPHTNLHTQTDIHDVSIKLPFMSYSRYIVDDILSSIKQAHEDRVTLVQPQIFVQKIRSLLIIYNDGVNNVHFHILSSIGISNTSIISTFHWHHP